MSAVCFVDSNLLVYSRDAGEPEKQPRAREWLAHLWTDRSGRLSTQVLNEYYVTVTSKLKPGLSLREAWEDVESLFAWRPLPVDVHVMQQGQRVQHRFGFSWWDSLIVAAAQIAGSTYLLTENLQDGQVLDGVVVLNPFAHAPSDLPLAV